MILYRLRRYDFCEWSESTMPIAPTPAWSAATVYVNLDIRTGEEGDLILQPVVELREDVHNPSPCLADVLTELCRRKGSQLDATNTVWVTRFLSNEHPETLMELVGNIETPTRRINFVRFLATFEDAIQAAEYGMQAAPHQLMAFKGLTRLASYKNVKILSFPDFLSIDDVVYWTGMAIRMSDRRDVLTRTSITTPFERTSGLKATIAHLTQHPRLKLAWDQG